MSQSGISTLSKEFLRNIFLRESSSHTVKDTTARDVIVEDIRSEGMLPVVLHRIVDSGSKWLPDSLVSKFRIEALKEAGLELLREVELKEVLQEMGNIGVQPILIKGTALSYTLYPDTGMRPRCDTDMLVPQASRKAVDAVFKKMGYGCLYEGDMNHISTQMTYSKKTGAEAIHSYDVHWQTNNNDYGFSGKLDYHRLYDRCLPIPRLGDNARMPNNVDALLLACFHRAGHYSSAGDRLIWLYDIHLLVEKLLENEIAEFCELADEYKIINICADAITVAGSWFGTSIPGRLKLFISERPAHEDSSVYLRRGREGGIKAAAFMKLKSMNSWRERVSFVFQNIFPPASYMLWRYGKKHKAHLPWLYGKRIVQGIFILVK